MKRKGTFTTENTENTEVDSVASVRSVVNTEDVPDGFQMTELGPLPEDWRVVRLGDVAERMKAGGTPSRKETRYWGGNIPFVLIEDMTSCGLYLASTKETITPEGLEHSSAWLVPPGSLLLSMYATIGKTCINLMPVATNQAILAIIPSSTFYPEFGAYLLKFYSGRLAQYNVQSTQKNVNKCIVENFRIPLPPLPEQRAIAHVLRTVQRAKEATEGVIAALRELKKSLMQHLFTYGPVPVTEREHVALQESELGPLPAHWRVVGLGEVVEKTKQIDPRKKPEWFFKYVDVSGVDNELLRITSYQNFAGKEAPSRARKQIDAGDVLFATVRPYLKRIAIVPPELDGHICSTAFCVLRAKNEIDACYLFFAVAHEPFVQRVAEHQRGSSYPAVTDQDVLREVIPLPPLDEQREIARMLQAVDAKIAAEQARRAALEELFKTLLHALMSGRRRVYLTTEK